MAEFKWNTDGLRQLESDIQRNIERDIAPRFKREQVEPLRMDLESLATTHTGDDEETIRREVLTAFARHQVEPGDIDPIVRSIRSGEPIGDIAVVVERPKLT